MAAVAGAQTRAEQDLNGTSAAERRLIRLRYDLHDGPQQDVIMLAEDLRLFQAQLQLVIDDDGLRERVRGRIDDLWERLKAIDRDLRRIASAAESPFLSPASLPESVADLASTFARRTGIEPELSIRGHFGDLTDSQHITLLGLIREALSNVREHSDAENVTIALSQTSDGVEATVTDNGRGFDPHTTLPEAARDGHLGLLGMHDRVRLVGGETRIESRPGGPTVICATLPRAPAHVPRREPGT